MIAITGANGHVGRAVRRRLEDAHLLLRGDDLAAGLRGADAVIHLAGTLAPRRGETYEQANLDPARAVARALAGSAVRRIAMVSYVDADAASPNPYLRAKALAERALQATGIPTLVLRCPWIFGPPGDPGPSFEPFIGRLVTVVGDGAQRLAPVYVEDVAEAAVRGARDPAGPTGILALAGPETLTLDAVVTALNPGRIRIRHVSAPAARLLARLPGRLTGPLVDVLLADSLPHDPPAAEALGLRLRSVGDVYVA